MMFYAVFENDSGKLFSTGTVLADPLPSKFDYKIYDHEPPENHHWDEQARDFLDVN